MLKYSTTRLHLHFNSMFFDYIQFRTFAIVMSSLKHSMFSYKTRYEWIVKQGNSIYHRWFKLSVKSQPETEKVLLWKSWLRANFYLWDSREISMKGCAQMELFPKKKRFFFFNLPNWHSTCTHVLFKQSHDTIMKSKKYISKMYYHSSISSQIWSSGNSIAVHNKTIL